MCQIANPSPSTDSTSGIPDCVPADPISQNAYSLAHKHLPLATLNHSLRAWIYAQYYSEEEPKIPSSKIPLLFTACILHDIGTTPAFAHIDASDELQRFGLEGADAAVAFLRDFGDPSIAAADIEEVEEVWRAIALHTSPQIAERMGGMVRALRLAICVEFEIGGIKVKEGLREETERKFARLGIEKVLGDAIVKQALDSRMPEKKAPGPSWPNNLLRAYQEDPHWDPINKGF